MDHRNVSNTVDSAFAFRVLGAAVTDMSSYSVVSVWCMKWSLRKFAAYVFNISALIFIYLSACDAIMNTTELHEWTGGPFMEPYVLLVNISILQFYGATI